jgi:hypothetical protein
MTLVSDEESGAPAAAVYLVLLLHLGEFLPQTVAARHPSEGVQASGGIAGCSD